jgi:hypothetical protein
MSETYYVVENNEMRICRACGCAHRYVGYDSRQPGMDWLHGLPMIFNAKGQPVELTALSSLTELDDIFFGRTGATGQ